MEFLTLLFVLPVFDENVTKVGDKWLALCKCSNTCWFSTKGSALLMIQRGACRYCKKHYSSVTDERVNIYQNKEGKWCSVCSGCGIEQLYTRKDHAKQSTLSDWQCKKCAQGARKFSQNQPVGLFRRSYNKFQKSANSRQIEWSLTFEEFESIFNGFCSLTGWPIDIGFADSTASLDRIDSSKGYEPENVRWVHKMVNMCKNKYSDELFIKMCVAIANNQIKLNGK